MYSNQLQNNVVSVRIAYKQGFQLLDAISLTTNRLSYIVGLTRSVGQNVSLSVVCHFLSNCLVCVKFYTLKLGSYEPRSRPCLRVV